MEVATEESDVGELSSFAWIWQAVSVWSSWLNVEAEAA